MQTEMREKQGKTRSFPLQKALRLVEESIKPFNKAALFELAESGYESTFQQVVACIISVRTLDEVTIPLARRLLDRAPSPKATVKLSEDEIYPLIAASTFARTKAKNILAIAKTAMKDYQGSLPCDEDVLLSLPGVGPKCANLVMGIACGQSKIGVDIHVHRVTNRWGYVQTRSPEETLRALEGRLPPKNWIDLNRLLVPFGKHICTGKRPKCSECPLNRICPQVGVSEHR